MKRTLLFAAMFSFAVSGGGLVALSRDHSPTVLSEIELGKLSAADVVYPDSICVPNTSNCCSTCVNLKNGGSLKCTATTCEGNCVYDPVDPEMCWDTTAPPGLVQIECGYYKLYDEPNCPGEGRTDLSPCNASFSTCVPISPPPGP